MRNLTRDQFEERVKTFWSPAIYEQCKHKIEPCDCGSAHCLGWTMKVTQDDWAASGIPEGVLEV